MLMKILLFIVVVFLIILSILGVNLGLFITINIKEKIMGPFELIYKEYIGPYKDTGKIQDEIYYSLLNKDNIETYKGFGIYYDDPKTTPDNKLRSKSGCILEEKDYDKKNRLQNNYNFMEIGKQKFMYAEFPCKSKFSIFMGMFKVYPKIEKYLEEKAYKKREVMEIYDVPNKKIIYLMPIEE